MCHAVTACRCTWFATIYVNQCTLKMQPSEVLCFVALSNISLATISPTPLHISSLNWWHASTPCTSFSRYTESPLVTPASMYGVSCFRRHLRLLHYCCVCAPCVYFYLFTTGMKVVRKCFL